MATTKFDKETILKSKIENVSDKIMEFFDNASVDELTIAYDEGLDGLFLAVSHRFSDEECSYLAYELLVAAINLQCSSADFSDYVYDEYSDEIIDLMSDLAWDVAVHIRYYCIDDEDSKFKEFYITHNSVGLLETESRAVEMESSEDVEKIAV